MSITCCFDGLRRLTCFVLLNFLAMAAVAADWEPHNVQLVNGTIEAIDIPSKRQIVTESWNRVVAVPYLAYMPEKASLLMLVGCDNPHQAMVMFSDDYGKTWTEPKYLHVDAKGKPDAGLSTGLTYLGNGKLMANQGATRWVSKDYGSTWAAVANPPASNGRPWIEWDPLLVDRNPTTGHVDQLMSFCSDNLQPDGHFQGYIRFSRDGGSTWVNEIKVPEMFRVNEVAFIRAKNGDVVAACRTDNPDEYKGQIDHYGGLAVSISKDNGRTWSDLNRLYAWGRHHPSMVLMPDGRIVMTHVVRKGYVDTPDGFPQFGVEAIVSADNGRTWDLDHKYILHTWAGCLKGKNKWWPSSQATSTVLLPDGSLLTAFGTGYRIAPKPGKPAPRDVGLIRWQLSDAPVNQARTIRDAPFDSDVRNVCVPKSRRLSGKNLGTIFNNDINNILHAIGTDESAVEIYRRAVDALLDMKPGVLAQNVGMPDSVIYRSDVATTFDKHLDEVSKLVWPKQKPDGQAVTLRRIFDAGTDPLAITIAACRKRGVPIVASYRMNSEDYYAHSWRMSDFGRAHPGYRIKRAGCLDPAIPEVYNHRMAIFREVVEKYDIDGLELDFRRWYRMVSNPLENHTVLTRMVRDVRKMLDEVAEKKGRSRLLLGVRVGPSLDSPPTPFIFPGIEYPRKPTNSSCRDLGLDVKTWIKEEIVDYVCPALFMGNLPGMPLTREFTELAEGTKVGIYPFMPSKSAWMHGTLFDKDRNVALTGDDRALAQYKYDLCTTALKLYADGADGISTYNWYSHLRSANVPNFWTASDVGAGADAVQNYIYPMLGDPEAIQTYLQQPWALPPKD